MGNNTSQEKDERWDYWTLRWGAFLWSIYDILFEATCKFHGSEQTTGHIELSSYNPIILYGAPAARAAEQYFSRQFSTLLRFWNVKKDGINYKTNSRRLLYHPIMCQWTLYDWSLGELFYMTQIFDMLDCRYWNIWIENTHNFWCTCPT